VQSPAAAPAASHVPWSATAALHAASWLISAQLAVAGTAAISAVQVQSPAVVPAASQVAWSAAAALHAVSWSISAHVDVPLSHEHEPPTAASQFSWLVAAAPSPHAAIGVVVQVAASKAVVDPTAVKAQDPAASQISWLEMAALQSGCGVVVQVAASKAVVEPTAVKVHEPAASHVHRLALASVHAADDCRLSLQSSLAVSRR